jgi:hypothetical protein
VFHDEGFESAFFKASIAVWTAMKKKLKTANLDTPVVHGSRTILSGPSLTVLLHS